MSWYWIVLIVFIYMILAIFTGALWDDTLLNDNELSTVAGVLWPITLPAIAIVGMLYLCSVAIELLAEISTRRKKENDNHTKITNA